MALHPPIILGVTTEENHELGLFEKLKAVRKTAQAPP
jgi:hypothetical protein